MILPIHRQLHRAVTEAISRTFALAEIPSFTIETPPNRTMGDLAVTVGFQLARTLRKPPRAIAQDLAAALGELPGIARITAAPNGYLNLFLERPSFLVDRVQGRVTADPLGEGKTVVEHTAINPNKAAHIG